MFKKLKAWFQSSLEVSKAKMEYTSIDWAMPKKVHADFLDMRRRGRWYRRDKYPTGFKTMARATYTATPQIK